MLRRYVYELERQVGSEQSELERLRKENKKLKKDILSLGVVKEAIIEAKSEAYRDCNTDWSGLQGGF